jgi:hypothetical protein
VLNRSVELSRRTARPLALIMLDLDHFKATNDSYGHQVGDQVLRQVAALIREQCRSTDLPGRWGGEEFLIVCPETGLGAAMVLAERLRARIAGHQFDLVSTRPSASGWLTSPPAIRPTACSRAPTPRCIRRRGWVATASKSAAARMNRPRRRQRRGLYARLAGQTAALPCRRPCLRRRLAQCLGCRRGIAGAAALRFAGA